MSTTGEKLHNKRGVPILFVALMLLVLSASACTTALSPSQIITRWNRLVNEPSPMEKLKKWEEDLDFLTRELERHHKNLYHSISREQFLSDTKKLKDNLSLLDDTGRFVEFVKLVASIGDPHTSIAFTAPVHWFPIQVYQFKEGTYVVAAGGEYADIVGWRLMSIGGAALEEIYQNLIPTVAHENEAMLKTGLTEVIRCAEVLKHYGYVDSLSEGNFVFQDQDGQCRDVLMATSLNILNYGTVRMEYLLDHPPTALSRQDLGKSYWYRYLETDNLLYFQYNACVDDRYNPFRKQSQGAMKVVDENNAGKFVLDLRNNKGGSQKVALPLLKALSDSKTINQTGHLFVIIGRATFSAAILNALKLKNETKAIFVGEPTGGKPNHFGAINSFNLPNSGLHVWYSKQYFESSTDDQDSLYPDILIEPSFSDYLSGTDPALEWIIHREPESN